MIRPKFFIWVVAPVVIYLIYLTWGSPHIAWNYSWRNNGTYDPFADRWYVSCEYIGSTGSHFYKPVDGKCPWFKFYKTEGDA